MNKTSVESYYDEKGNFHETKIVKTIKKGISFGSCLAMVISYTAWNSVGWAIVHGLFGWLYVLYYVIKY